MLDHFLAMNKIIKENNPETKFVIFLYDWYGVDINSIINELQKNGILVIRNQDISKINFYINKEYKIEGDSHPNEKAWDTIVPLFAKELKL